MPKTILIDASSQVGGGITLLQSLLSWPNDNYQFIILLPRSSTKSFSELPNVSVISIDTGTPFSIRRLIWLIFGLFMQYKKYNADLLFILTPLYLGPPLRLYTLIQNALPFSLEKRRYGFSLQLLRLYIIKIIGFITIKRSAAIASLRADHAISFSSYCKNSYLLQPGCSWKKVQDSKNLLIDKDCIRIVYVSTIDVYKHQLKLIPALEKLHADGINFQVNFIGSLYHPYHSRVFKRLQASSIKDKVIFNSFIASDQLAYYLANADIALFLSSCECFPNILLDYAAFSIPLICSSFPPMPSILSDSCIYVNPENSDDIYNSLKDLISSPTRMHSLSAKIRRLFYQYTQKKSSYMFCNSLNKIFDLY